MSIIKKIVGQNIQRIRKQKGMTQADLAEKIEVDISSITRAEIGLNIPRDENLIRITRVLDVPLEELFREHVENRQETIKYIENNIYTLDDIDLTLLKRNIETMKTRK